MARGIEGGRVSVINVISDKTEPAPVSRDQLYSQSGRGWRDNEDTEDFAFVSNKSSAIIREVFCK